MRHNLSELMNEKFISVGMGTYSLEEYLALVLIGNVVFVLILVTAAMVRGAGRDVAIQSVRDILIAELCALGILTFPGAFYFGVRAVMGAFFGKSAIQR